MNNVIKKMRDSGWVLNPGVSDFDLDEARKSMGLFLPEDFLNFLITHNGGEGYLGEEYLILWKLNELLEFNDDYEVEKYAPGLFLFGSNGGGEGFAFDRDNAMVIVMIPFIGMNRKYARFLANDFTSFLLRFFSSQHE
ncbi:SMI1/KNR4 family protein [Fulvimonas soli]|uniref:SMI1/KNR4 family protein n=1 Tax=Fulvimonas soli TaxID=155197 RepID=UPI001B86E4CE|nr:SMI1/KNR4 family protein [Fulvimonas soli]TNY26228.1 hypothetical protein BV497_09850 [Fulvimonas soli]